MPFSAANFVDGVNYSDEETENDLHTVKNLQSAYNSAKCLKAEVDAFLNSLKQDEKTLISLYETLTQLYPNVLKICSDTHQRENVTSIRDSIIEQMNAVGNRLKNRKNSYTSLHSANEKKNAQLQAVSNSIKNLEEDINDFVACNMHDEKKMNHLNEQLTKLLISLDGISSDGHESIRAKRKLLVEQLISVEIQMKIIDLHLAVLKDNASQGMSKRRAEKQLLKDDVDLSDEEEDAGEFTKADVSELSQRVIKTARRRNPDSSVGPSPFSAFTGFTTGAPSSSNAFNTQPKSVSAVKDSTDQSTSKADNVATPGKGDMESLKALNISCSKWIEQHLEKNPYVILLPVFKDYEKHLSTLNIGGSASGDSSNANKEAIKNSSNTFFNNKTEASQGFSFGTAPKSETSKASTVSSTTFSPFQFNSGETKVGTAKSTTDSPNFGFNKQSTDSKTTSSESTAKKTLGAVSSTTFPAFQFNSNNSTSTFGSTWADNKNSTNNDLFKNTPTPGIGPGFFSNSAPATNSTEAAKEGEPSDEPPESNFVPVGEEDSVFDIKCKLFAKKADTFASIGVGKLYLKKVGGKTQLIVRADTAQGSVLLNLILTPDLPLQSTGKNNVLLVCIPTPDAEPPPVPILIRVKSGEERDRLLEEMNRLR